MAADSTGLLETVNKANNLYKTVKQTSDATLDSRLLVSTGDIAARRSVQLKAGGTSVGIDVDDFVAKCVSFMRKISAEDGSQPHMSTQQRRHRRDASADDSGAEGGHDEGDEMNWEYLGRRVCFPNNVRPPVSGFLLGPLSVQKRVRQQTQRRERLKKQDPRDAVRPEELQSKDIERVENANLTSQCKNIAALLDATQNEREARVRDDATEDMTEEQIVALMHKHGIAINGGVSFFEFVVNPRSFGQTVENMFYVSFLIRDGQAGILTDGDGLPTLRKSPYSAIHTCFMSAKVFVLRLTSFHQIVWPLVQSRKSKSRTLLVTKQSFTLTTRPGRTSSLLLKLRSASSHTGTPTRARRLVQTGGTASSMSWVACICEEWSSELMFSATFHIGKIYEVLVEAYSL